MVLINATTARVRAIEEFVARLKERGIDVWRLPGNAELSAQAFEVLPEGLRIYAARND